MGCLIHYLQGAWYPNRRITLWYSCVILKWKVRLISTMVLFFSAVVLGIARALVLCVVCTVWCGEVLPPSSWSDLLVGWRCLMLLHCVWVQWRGLSCALTFLPRFACKYVYNQASASYFEHNQSFCGWNPHVTWLLIYSIPDKVHMCSFPSLFLVHVNSECLVSIVIFSIIG